MTKQNQVNGFIWLLLGALLCIGSIPLNLGGFHKPGPGFMPRILALALGVLAILIWVEATPSSESQNEVESYSKREPLVIFLLVLAYVFVMPHLGFLLSNFILVIALRRMVEPGSWRGDLAGAMGTALIIHLVFVQILALQFPIFPVWWER